MAVTHTAFTIAYAVPHITGTKSLHKELKSPARVLAQDTSTPRGYEPQATQWPGSPSNNRGLHSCLSVTPILQRQLIRRDNCRERASAGTLSLCKLSHSLGSWQYFVPVASLFPSDSKTPDDLLPCTSSETEHTSLLDSHFNGWRKCPEFHKEEKTTRNFSYTGNHNFKRLPYDSKWLVQHHLGNCLQITFLKPLSKGLFL